MRVCIVLNSLEVGGVTSSAVNFCRECVNRGNDVYLVNMSNSEFYFDKDIKIKRLGGIRKFWNLNSQDIQNANALLKIMFLFLASIKKVLNKKGKWFPLIFSGYRIPGEYDVVLAYRQCAPCYYFALHCVNAKNKIGMIHGDLDFMGDISSWDYIFPEFDKIACVSDAVRDGFRKRYLNLSDFFVTLYNMFDIEDIKVKAKEDVVYKINKDIVNIISVARHENGHKKVNRVAECCAILNKKGVKDYHWYVAGGGPDFDVNVQQARDLGVQGQITYCGPMENPFALLSRSDFLVLTSMTESFGMVVIEAKILNKPSVVMKYPCINEILKDGIDGLVAEQTIEDLAEKVAMMIENRNGILENTTKHIVEAGYSNETAYQQFLNCVTK